MKFTIVGVTSGSPNIESRPLGTCLDPGSHENRLEIGCLVVEIKTPRETHADFPREASLYVEKERG